MKAGLNKIKIAIISMIVLAMAIGQLELFGKVYAEELEKIKEQDPYGEYYDENINNVHKTSAQIIEKGNPDVITKEPSVDEEDTSRQNDQEIVKLRTENTKTYKLSSGEYVTDFYFEQIHKKEDGKYVEIDNDIEKKTSLFRSTPSYENKDGLYDINIQKGVLEITDPKDNVLTVMPSGSLTNYAIKENVILYSEVEKNLDLEYRINSNTVSQNIYINGELDKDTYSFEVYKDDYDVSKNDAGSIVFKKDKKEVFVLNAPYLVDKDGNRNQEVGYDYKELDNGNIKVTLSLTTSWLSEEDRVYLLLPDQMWQLKMWMLLILNQAISVQEDQISKVNIQICLLDMMITSMVVKTAILKLQEHSSILQCQISVKIKELKMLF